MIRGKMILSVLLAIIVIQAGFSIGFPLNRGDLQMLLMNALKVADCARIVPVTEPLPLRFRRATNRKKFQCIISLN